MVEYFGEKLNGFAFSNYGWVQSYGSRCVKPPILFGDVSREKPMTIKWSAYAQSLSSIPVKGMLTGPVTILQWSFVRNDQPRAVTCNQIALAIAAMDADVITIETSRSDMELLDAFVKFKYPNEIGPGVYDIHSPRVPSLEEIEALLIKAKNVLPKEHIWVNPDCGLKTRDWPETKEALKNLVKAATNLRKEESILV